MRVNAGSVLTMKRTNRVGQVGVLEQVSMIRGFNCLALMMEIMMINSNKRSFLILVIANNELH